VCINKLNRRGQAAFDTPLPLLSPHSSLTFLLNHSSLSLYSLTPPAHDPQGTTYPDALFAQDFSTDVSPSQEGRSNTGGYALLWLNTGRPCTAYVPTSCLDGKSMDACTQDLTEALLSGAQQHRQRGGGLGPAALAAAVAVPVVLAGEGPGRITVISMMLSSFSFAMKLQAPSS